MEPSEGVRHGYEADRDRLKREVAAVRAAAAAVDEAAATEAGMHGATDAARTQRKLKRRR